MRFTVIRANVGFPPKWRVFDHTRGQPVGSKIKARGNADRRAASLNARAEHAAKMDGKAVTRSAKYHALSEAPAPIRQYKDD